MSKKRFTIDDMKSLAESKGGKCHSTTYKSTKYKLHWECSQKHRWESTPEHVKRGYWCPYCSGIRRGKDDLHL